VCVGSPVASTDPNFARKIEAVLGIAAMSNSARTIELPEDLQAFAEERVRAGEYASVADVVRDALEQKKLAALREALDVGINELDAGQGVETTPDELVDDISTEVGLDP
jgi:putative addiction module CopG family antidote